MIALSASKCLFRIGLEGIVTSESTVGSPLGRMEEVPLFATNVQGGGGGGVNGMVIGEMVNRSPWSARRVVASSRDAAAEPIPHPLRLTKARLRDSGWHVAGNDILERGDAFVQGKAGIKLIGIPRYARDVRDKGETAHAPSPLHQEQEGAKCTKLTGGVE